MPIPLTAGLPITPSNLITKTPSSFTETLKSTNCNALLAPTTAKISKSDRTCCFHHKEELLSIKISSYSINKRKESVLFAYSLPFLLGWIHWILSFPWAHLCLWFPWNEDLHNSLQVEDYWNDNRSFPTVLIDRWMDNPQHRLYAHWFVKHSLPHKKCPPEF